MLRQMCCPKGIVLPIHCLDSATDTECTAFSDLRHPGQGIVRRHRQELDIAPAAHAIAELMQVTDLYNQLSLSDDSPMGWHGTCFEFGKRMGTHRRPEFGSGWTVNVFTATGVGVGQTRCDHGSVENKPPLMQSEFQKNTTRAKLQ